MDYYTIELLDTKDHVFFSTCVLATSITHALESAKVRAYNLMDKHNIVIRYIHVKDKNIHYYSYNMLTKTLHNKIKEHQTKWNLSN